MDLKVLLLHFHINVSIFSRSDEKKYTNMNKTLSNKAKGVAEKNKGKKTTKLRHT